jgi:type II secretory pathway pseudopilin PulG
VLKDSLKVVHSITNQAALVVVIVVFFGIFIFPLFYSQKKAKQLKAELREIGASLESYHSETGSWPSPGGRSVAEALLGGGGGEAYSEHERRDGDGRFIDPWETPYRFYFSKSGFAIQSAGKNGKYAEGKSDTGDDVWFSEG